MSIVSVPFAAIYGAMHGRESQDQLNEGAGHKALNARRKGLYVIHSVTGLVYDLSCFQDHSGL